VSYWSEIGLSAAGTLHGAGGNLVIVRVRVDSRRLEDLLEALASADFPINPEIRHGYPETVVEFPAYENQIAEIRRLTETAGVQEADLDMANMMQAIA